MAPIRCCFDQTAVWHSDAARGPSTPSFDYLVGGAQERRRHVEAERLGRLEVDHKLVLGRCLHRQVAWILPLQNSIDVRRGSPEQINIVGAVRHQTALGGEKA